MKKCAVVIDDEKPICLSLEGALQDEGWEVHSAQNGSDGTKLVQKHKPQIVFLDVWMPGQDGITTLQKIRDLDTEAFVVIMSGHATIDTAVKVTKLGASEFLEKPLSLDSVLQLAEKSCATKPKKQAGTALIGASSKIDHIRKSIVKLSDKDACVLVTGENGSGKEIVARMIHSESRRKDEVFVPVNCAAIPEELIESELFGHVKGAFTHALASRKGRFEQADKGTLFLDEIGDMTLKTQAKILRALEHQEFEAVGGTKTIKTDVRIIAATNKDLKVCIKNGDFREDLFYRLNVVPFYVPPLRERSEDIVELVEFFSRDFAVRSGEVVKEFMPDAFELMKKYRWPGNTRELKNFIERIYIFHSPAKVARTDLVELFRDQSEDVVVSTPSEAMSSAEETLKDAKSLFEKEFIIQKLNENHWNISKTAERIGVERSNLHRKLKMYNIEAKPASDKGSEDS